MKKYLLLLFCLLSMGAFAQVDSPEDGDDIELSEEEMELMNEAMEAIFSGGEVEVKDSYTFNFEYTIEMAKTSVLKDTPKQEIVLRFNEDEKLMNMEMENVEGNEAQVSVIFNYDTKEMITMTEQGGQKIGFAMKIPNLTEIGSTTETEEEMPNIVSTGKTETILGYVCDIKEMKQGNSTYTIWVAQDDSVLPSFSFAAFTEMNGQKETNDWMSGNESVLKMTEKTDDNTSSFTYEVTEIKGDTKTVVSTEGYQFAGLFGE